jgi:hypothetical protein
VGTTGGCERLWYILVLVTVWTRLPSKFGGLFCREKYRNQEWQTWSQKELSELLRIAINQVPYYKETWNEAQKQASFSGDLQSLHLLDKKTICTQPRAFVRQGSFPHKEYILYTISTTGMQIVTTGTCTEIRSIPSIRA